MLVPMLLEGRRMYGYEIIKEMESKSDCDTFAEGVGRILMDGGDFPCHSGIALRCVLMSRLRTRR